MDEKIKDIDIDAMLSYIKELEEYLNFWQNSYQQETAHSLQCEKRVKELEDGIKKHRDLWGFEVGQVNSTYYSKRDKELYRLVEDESK